MTVALIALAAAIGGPTRYLTDRALRARFGATFPWGTLAVNVVGSFLFGLITAVAAMGRLDDAAVAALGTGFCGALTTYSTFGYETLRLVEGRFRLYAAANVVVSVAAGLGAACLGWALGGGLA